LQPSTDFTLATESLNDAALLFESEGGDPNGDQAVLAVGKSNARVSGDLQEEPTITPGVGRLTVRRTAKRDAAEDKRSGVVSKFLLVLITLLADELEGLQVFSLRLVRPMDGKTDWSGVKDVTPRAVDVGVRSSPIPLGVCQKCAKSGCNGRKRVRL